MKHPPNLKHDAIYHIYNRGINSTDLFTETTNYEHFIRLYDLHVTPVAETYAFVLMKNHFHIMVRILSMDEIGFIKPKEDKDNRQYPVRKKHNPTQQFGNLFNAYTKTPSIMAFARPRRITRGHPTYR